MERGASEAEETMTVRGAPALEGGICEKRDQARARMEGELQKGLRRACFCPIQRR